MPNSRSRAPTLPFLFIHASSFSAKRSTTFLSSSHIRRAPLPVPPAAGYLRRRGHHEQRHQSAWPDLYEPPQAKPRAPEGARQALVPSATPPPPASTTAAGTAVSLNHLYFGSRGGLRTAIRRKGGS
jgi:hypothetical protein